MGERGERVDRLPLVVQSDLSLLLEVDHPLFEEARDALVGIAELVKSPEHVHTYRLSHLSLWNAVASGLTPDEILARLTRYSQYPIPREVAEFVEDQARRYGRLRLVVAPDGDGLWLTGSDATLLQAVGRHRHVAGLLGPPLAPGFRVAPERRGLIKQALAKIGWPVDDQAGYAEGTPLSLAWKSTDRRGRPFALRRYQVDAVQAFWGDGRVDRGSGIVVLPCGAGKTLVGIGAMERVQRHTLILTTSLASLHQWREELLDKTTLTAEAIGEYSAAKKEVRPVTLTTYQLLAHRRRGQFEHFQRLDREDWGLIIYDEVHLLPAPIFRLTASLQARRRLGLTATLVREDGRADDVFALIGPKRFDVPWRELEAQGWIATAQCREIRVRMPESLRQLLAASDPADQVRLCAENPAKLSVVEALVHHHAGDHILVIGQYLAQLEALAHRLNAPLVTGKTPPRQREELYERFRQGEIRLLVVSKVANFAIDLPDANVAIQVSGTFGSRQEEAQRLGRILRPKSNGAQAVFYTVVSEESPEQEFAQKRQLFLCEQGYRYEVAHADEHGRPVERVLSPVIPFRARS
ncbi:MAG: helicase-associated domain-containing protein [Firmicutes bacterium]|nr:helicase-associated domain-containing protein [Alicyclobacillaceae bacterium]MCL6497260.1 helicase-associated domain-containing protein [Bacillota bacterium]